MRRWIAMLVLAAGLLATSTAEAQWVLLARRVVGRVEQMSQSTPDNSVSYDTAAVILEAPADKIYATALRSISAAPGITVTSSNAEQLQIQFTNGTQIAGMKVSPLGNKLSHMLISSAHTGTQPNAALLVMNGVMRVCSEMKVKCEPAGTSK